MTRRGAALENLDSDHAAAAADAGHGKSCKHIGGRRPKAAKERTRGFWAPTVQRGLWGFE